MNTHKMLHDLITRAKKHKASDIAVTAGLTRQTVSKIISGVEVNPTIGTLQKISDACERLARNKSDGQEYR